MIPNQPDVTNKIFGLDLVRVIAVLLVLGSHSLWIYPDYNNLLTKVMDFAGFIGAEIFFVLSGFLIGSSLFRLYMKPEYKPGAAIRFIRRRSMRILPNYLLLLVVNLIIAAWMGYTVAHPLRYFAFVQNFATPMLPFFPESWTMPVKELAYLILPFLLLGLTRFLNTARYKLFLATAFSLIILSISAKILFHFRHPHIDIVEWNIALRSVVIYRVDAVLTGVVCSYYYLRYPKLWEKCRFPAAIVASLLMAGIISAIAILNVHIDEFPIFWNIFLLPLISVSLALYLPLLSGWKRAGPRLEIPVHFIGGVSYALYLVHYSLILFLLKYHIYTLKLTIVELHICTMIYLSSSFTLAYLIHRFYEKPLLRLNGMKT